MLDGDKITPVALQFETDGGYVDRENHGKSFSRKKLMKLASEGRFVGTFTARLGPNSDYDHPQPAIWTLGPIQVQRGHQKFPTLYPGNGAMKLSGRHIQAGAHLIVDGRKVAGSLELEDQTLKVTLGTLPPTGMHFLQIQNPGGLLSNDFIFHVAEDAREARDLLFDAVLRDDMDLVKNLIEHGANVNVSNDDGNTPLHVAAFMCHLNMVHLLLDKGAAPLTKNHRGETSIAVVSGPWSQQLGGFYALIGAAEGLQFDLPRIERERRHIAGLLRDFVER